MARSRTRQPTRMRCVCAMTQRAPARLGRDSNWPVSPTCVSVACGCVSVALLTFLQPRMRNRTCANLRSVVAASDETPVSHVTPPAPLARVRTSRREAPHAPPRPAWPVSRRATLWHALSHVSTLTARPAPRVAPRARRGGRRRGTRLQRARRATPPPCRPWSDAVLKEEGAVPPMPSGAFVKEEQVAPPMPPGAFVKEEGVVPPMPPDAIVTRSSSRRRSARRRSARRRSARSNAAQVSKWRSAAHIRCTRPPVSSERRREREIPTPYLLILGGMASGIQAIWPPRVAVLFQFGRALLRNQRALSGKPMSWQPYRCTTRVAGLVVSQALWICSVVLRLNSKVRH